jgi:hypothetical protein
MNLKELFEEVETNQKSVRIIGKMNGKVVRKENHMSDKIMNPTATKKMIEGKDSQLKKLKLQLKELKSKFDKKEKYYTGIWFGDTQPGANMLDKIQNIEDNIEMIEMGEI